MPQALESVFHFTVLIFHNYIRNSNKKGGVSAPFDYYGSLFQDDDNTEFLALLANMVGSSSSPQQVHFHALKERTKS